MNWDAIGAIAEVIGAIAVIITLAYLAIQIRQNSRLLESSLVEAHVNAASEISKILATDSDAANIFWDGLENSRDSLNLEQRRRFDALIFLFVTSGYQAYRQKDDAALTRADWILNFQGFQDWWVQYSGTYPQDFTDYIATRKSAA